MSAAMKARSGVPTPPLSTLAITKIPRTTDPINAPVGFDMNHQCGFRSRTSSSLSFSSFRGNAIRVPYRPRWSASPVAELLEAGVVDAEVVAHLVDDGHPHLLDDLLLGVAASEDRRTEDREAIGHRAADAVLLAMRQRPALVEPEQPHPVRPVLDEHGDVLHEPPELLRDPIERVRDELLEPAVIHIDRHARQCARPNLPTGVRCPHQRRPTHAGTTGWVRLPARGRLLRGCRRSARRSATGGPRGRWPRSGARRRTRRRSPS